jgi:hypothetical protein
VDLDAYVSRKAVSGENAVFMLDTATGVLE